MKTLKKKGYNVEGLPADVKEFENMIQRQGSVLGTYALGAYDRFINEGNPALVSENNFYTWAKAQFPDSLINDIELKYGQFPGDYMSVSKNAEKLLSVARIEFGNVAILPQPMASTGEDIEKIVHGVNGAPAYPYIASYLWTKYEFKADAIVHFGTHGSLEFIPGKQIALSDYDWSDAIIGDMPHFYIYTINNIGEGIIAKRRSYATLISHLTAPFFRSELYDDLAKIKNMVHKMDNMEEGPLRQSYRESITKLASSENITSALGLDTTRVLNDEEIEQIHIYLEEIEGAKVNDGLYTLGIPYTKKEIENTTRLMSLDPIRYSLANLDLSRGKISQKEIENIAFISHNYDKKGEDIIRKSMKSSDPYSIFQDLLTSEELLIMQKDSLSPVLESINTLKETIFNVALTKKNLENSTSYEENALIDALSGRYVQPSSAGDPIINPRAIPTGKNFYSINPEVTPTPQAWKVGEKLAKSLLESELKNAGAYPQKVSFTLWSTDFISSEGATIAQILYLLGVEPIRDGFGYIRSLKLIPSQELGRPRIDVVVQTSGQLRDIAASRLKLINDAVLMAAADSSSNNNVAKGFKDAEALLLLKGFSLLEARTYAQQRVFGGVGGNYGTGIMGMVEKSDSWEDRAEIGEKYLFNMGAMYSSNGDDSWGEYKEGVFEAALLNTSVVVQPRSSNTWGPLSLDHVYEFMGGLSSAVENVTGVDPRAYFNDFRNPANARTQGLKEAIGVETNSTVFNPKYIKKMMTEGPSAMAHFSETFKNTFGWNTMKPSAIDQHIWNKYYEVYVEDVYNLGVKRAFEESNPYALEEMTAVMLEAVRKDMWKASEKQIKEVSKLHSQLLSDYDAACSGFVCDNAKLREFISSKLPMDKAKEYNQKISQERQVQIKSNAAEKNVVLKKESKTKKENAKIDQKSLEPEENPVLNTLLILSVAILVLVSLWIFSKRLKDKK